MNVIEPSQLARVGRDPNDTTWVIARYADDFRPPDPLEPRSPISGAILHELFYDARRGALELTPKSLSFSSLDREWLPLEPVQDASGSRFRSDPHGDRILTAAPCRDDFVALEGFGGPGWQTGRVRGPLGLSIDARGFLLVADAGNHRVQIVSGSDVVVVLGGVDAWGKPRAGREAGAMQEPTHAVIDPCSCRVFVADREAGLVHVFDRRFAFVQSFEPPTSVARPAGKRPRPAALALRPDGSLLILDTSWPRVLHVTAAGEPLAELSLEEAPEPAWARLASRQRYAARGEALIGPFDSGRYDADWHRVIIEARFPRGTSASVRTFASNDATFQPSGAAWAPARPVAMPLAPIEGGEREFSRLVLADDARWIREQHGDYGRAYPELAGYAGVPSGVTELALPAASLALVQAGDTIELDDGGPVEVVTLGALAAVPVTLSGSGAARVYPVGTRLRLLERNGERIVPPRDFGALEAGEALDLSGWTDPGLPTQRELPHRLAALLRPLDRVELELGDDRAELEIGAVHWANAPVPLLAPVGRAVGACHALLRDTPGRLLIDASDGFEGPLPPGEPLMVFSEAASLEVRVRWVEADRGAIWVDPPLLGGALTPRNWRRLSSLPAVATDKGQFLWVLLTVNGRLERPSSALSVETPSIFSIRALVPRLSYLAYLPALYARRDAAHDPPGALFIERFLALFEAQLTRAEALYESVSRQLNPRVADPEWLRFVSAWLGLVFDPTWDETRRRQLVLEAAELFRRRGTPEGLRRYIEIYTGRRPEIVEAFQLRPPRPLVVGGSGVLGVTPLGRDPCNPDDAGAPFAPYAHRFTLFVWLDEGGDFDAQRASLERIIESVKPAHSECSLCFVDGNASVGLRSTVGVDSWIGGEDDARISLGEAPSAVGNRVRPRIGFERVASPGPSPGLRLEPGGARLDQGFTLR
jgi:phage tail-like protein